MPQSARTYFLKEHSIKVDEWMSDIGSGLNYKRKNFNLPRFERQYRIGQSKALLDEIDAVLARYYHFTADELEFIIHYDQKYRMGSGGQ